MTEIQISSILRKTFNMKIIEKIDIFLMKVAQKATNHISFMKAVALGAFFTTMTILALQHIIAWFTMIAFFHLTCGPIIIGFKNDFSKESYQDHMELLRRLEISYLPAMVLTMVGTRVFIPELFTTFVVWYISYLVTIYLFSCKPHKKPSPE